MNKKFKLFLLKKTKWKIWKEKQNHKKFTMSGKFDCKKSDFAGKIRKSIYCRNGGHWKAVENYNENASGIVKKYFNFLAEKRVATICDIMREYLTTDCLCDIIFEYYNIMAICRKPAGNAPDDAAPHKPQDEKIQS